LDISVWDTDDFEFKGKDKTTNIKNNNLRVKQFFVFQNN